MSKAAIPCLNAEVERVLALIDSLTDAEWNAASGCTGWRVQEVVAHMGAVWHSLCGDTAIPSDPGGDAEKGAEMAVELRRSWTPAQVADDYREWAPKGVAALAALQESPMADTVAPLGNLGAHPLHILGNAIVFDHYCHLRHDIGAGVQRAADLPRDPEALAAILEWMLMGLPQMCADALSKAPSQVVNLHFTGVAQGDFVLTPGAPLWTVMPGAQAGAPTVTSSAHDFVSWGTQRADWRKTSSIAGNGADAAGAVLDAINII